jgi:hypothetical protein
MQAGRYVRHLQRNNRPLSQLHQRNRLCRIKAAPQVIEWGCQPYTPELPSGAVVQSAAVSVPFKASHHIGAIAMHKILVALVLAACGAATAAASDRSDVVGVLHQFTDAFNKGDMKAALAICADVISIIDDVPPHEWHGAGACSRWSGDLDAFDKANEITAGAVTLGKPRHIDITADRAYVVVPASYTFTMKSKPMKQSGSILTAVLQKGASGWRVSAWAWSDGTQAEAKSGT